MGDIFYNVTLPSLPLSSTLTDPENLAREKFYQKYRSAQTSFQGGVFLGELKETLRMLRSPAKALRKKIGSAYDAMYRNRHKAGRTVRSRNRYLSETWLEQSYGWAPLINDVKDAHETLEKRKEWLQREEIYVSAPYVATTETLTTGPGDVNLGYVSKYKDTKTSLVWYRGTIRAGRDSVFQSERHLWGFDPSMIVPTVWELIPYSFLIDYFTNIGKVLDSWSLQRVTLGWGARTERRSVIRQIVDVRDTFNPSLYPVVNERTFYPSEFTYHNTTFYRVPINEVPLPDFRFKIPGFGSKWINIAALTRVKTSKWW